MKQGLKAKITALINYVKAHWNKPADGEVVSLKEFASYCFGTMGICGFTYVCNDLIVFASGYFCGAIMGISLIDFSIIAIIAVIVRYATLYMEPLTMTVFENLGDIDKKTAKKCLIAYISTAVVGICFYFIPSDVRAFESIIKGLPQIVANIMVISGVGNLFNWFIRKKFCKKYGRYKPFLLFYGIPVAIISSVIPYIPATLDYTTKLVLLHALFTLRSRFTLLYNDAPSSIVQVVTPNSVERQRFYSIGVIFLGFLRSIFRLILPLLIIFTGGYLDAKTYQVFIPILSAVSVALGFVIVNVKERVIEKENRPRVEFKKSFKSLVKNKYFWITNISSIFTGWNYLADNVINWFIIYNMRLEWITGFVGIVAVTSVVGNLLTPLMVKKFEKRTVIIVLRSIWLVVTACYLIALKMNSIFMLMLFIFIKSAVSAAANGLNSGFNADVLDYHQWKTGERADNMMGVFSWFTTPIITVLGLLMPFVLKQFGFTSDWGVLFDSDIFTKVVMTYVVFTIIGLIMSTIPFIFYDLTKNKHAQYVKEIKERVEGVEETTESTEEIIEGPLEEVASAVVGGSENE